jgi:hypothetical protein
MHKSITYSSFFIFGIIITFLFIMSKSYEQLIIATVLYPILVVLAFRIFPRNNNESHTVTVELPKVNIPKFDKEDIGDSDKRDFLKLIGIAGASFFIFSILNRRVTNLPFIKKVAGSETTGLEDVKGNLIDPAQTQPTDGYIISEVDDNAITFYGFVKKGGAWFIMREDTDSGSFRYTKGDEDFSNNWTSREALVYDYYSNVF